MKIWLLIFVIGSAFTAYSQSDPLIDKKDRVNRTDKFYRKYSELPRTIINRYSKLVTGSKGFGQKDTLAAKRLIKKLTASNSVFIQRLMIIRLEWNFKQPLSLSRLNHETVYVKNNLGSANFNHISALYFEDKIDSTIARKIGYVRSDVMGNDWVDWKKMRSFIFGDPKLMRDAGIYGWGIEEGLFSGYNKRLFDTCTFFYEKAIKDDPTEFYFIQEFLSVLRKYNKEKLLQQSIKKYIDKYTLSEQQCLRQYQEASISREELSNYPVR